MEYNNLEFYIDDHAALFGFIAKSADETLGDEGLHTCGNGVTLMARERGLRMAMRCIANGDTLTTSNYLCYAELNDKDGWNKVEMNTLGPEYQTSTLRCGWFETWHKYGLEKYSKVYCDFIDSNVVYGFNPDIQLEMNEVLANGDTRCHFRWVDFGFADETELDAMKEKRTEMLADITKSFLYQTGHLLSAMKRTFYLEHGLNAGNAIIDKALDEYAGLFSAEKADQIRKVSEQNFMLP